MVATILFLAAPERAAFRIEQAWAVSADDLQQVLLRYRPAIVHFSGHGSAAGEILLDDGNGHATPVPPRALAGLFRILGRGVRCAVLNACYSEAQARAIVEHVDVVIGMSTAVDDWAAIAFARGVASFDERREIGASGRGGQVPRRAEWSIRCMARAPIRLKPRAIREI